MSSATEEADVLFIGAGSNHVASGLRALEVPFREVTASGLIKGDACVFDHRVLICGMDVRREGFAEIKDAVRAFAETGGVVLCFRSSNDDPWLPSPLKKDRTYTLGKRLVPEHAIFNTPHVLDEAKLRAVHGGSIYAGFYALGAGWRPLLSAGRQQSWDETPSQHEGEHFGILELELGRGRIVICQMIPAYAWFNDAKGNADCEGARLFENLVRYALSSAAEREEPRKPRVRPTPYATGLAGIMRTPSGHDGLRLDDPEWRFTGKGPFRGRCDRRGVYTISHGNTPAEAGNFGQLARRIRIAEGAERVMLRVYQSDDYCGGPEPKMVGDRRVSTSMNRKQGHRFRQVLVDDAIVVETDVLGRNVQPAVERIQWYDITELVRDKPSVTLALRVVDQKDSGDESFPTDGYFASIDVRTDFLRIPATRLVADGYLETDKGMALGGARGSLSLTPSVPPGRYVVAFRLEDHPYGQSAVEILANGDTAVAVRASADDFHFWWLTTPLLPIDQGTEIVLRTQRDGEEPMVVSDVALIPADLCKTENQPPALDRPAARSPVFKPHPPAMHDRVALEVTETAGAVRIGEVASQAVQFAFGTLRSPSWVAVTAGGKHLVPSQTRPFAFWPDGSIQAAVVTFPVDVNARAKAHYQLHFGSEVSAAEVPEPLTVEETADTFTIDTGRIRVDVPRRSGRILSALSMEGKAIAMPDGASWQLEMETEEGRVSRPNDATVTSCVLAERGPLRAIVVKTGKLADETGELIEYRYEIHFTRGSAEVRFFPRFSNVAHAEGVFVKRLSLQLPWQTDGASVYYSPSEDAEPVRVETSEPIELYQHLHDTLTISGDGVPGKANLSRAPGRLTGWTVLDGAVPLKVALRYAWQMYPKRMRVDDGLTIDLVPPPRTDEDVPDVAKQSPEVPGRNIGGVGYPQAMSHPGVFRLSVGESISHELWLCFGDDDPRPAEEQFAAGLNPLRAWADPRYVAATRAFCSFHPTDASRFPRYEKAVDGAFDVFMKRRRDRGQYGMENFGDDTFEWGYGPTYTFWSNQEDDRTHGMLMQYVRSGDARWWEVGEQAARHYRDVDCILASPHRPGDVGGPIHHNSRHFVSKDWVADHTYSTPGTGHSWIEGLIDYWLLTGDLLAGEAAVRMGDWYVGKVDAFQFGAGSQERGQGWTLTALTSIYRATWDPRYLDAAQRVQDWINEWQDPVRGVISVPISEQPSYEGGTTFMHGIVAHGVARLYEVSGDAETLRSLRGLSEWIVTEPMGPAGRFWYKQAPSCKRGYSYNGKAMTAMSYLYEFTGDDYMATVTEEIFNHTSPNIRSMPFLTPTLAHLAKWREPQPSTQPSQP
ncbi:MAG: beta-L-arabinofuranosidase domain-containing protein [Pirellulaceae bacterium]